MKLIEFWLSEQDTRLKSWKIVHCAIELAKVHDVGEATVADIKKWRCDTENYLMFADSSVAAIVEKS